MPPSAPAGELRALSLLAQERATAHLAARGRLPFFHLKQAAAVASAEGFELYGAGDARAARAFGDALGATHVAFSTLSSDPRGNRVLEVSVSSAGKPLAAPKKVTLPKGLAPAAEAAGLALANALDAATGKKAPAKGESWAASDGAAQAYARCLQAVTDQPVGVENPAVLDEAALAEAISSGEAAVAGNAGDGARAALGLAQAIAGLDEKAAATLQGLAPGPKLPTLAWVGRFWLVTRYKSDDDGLAVLRDAEAAAPTNLLLRGYLGELFQVLGRHDAALEAFGGLLALAPRDPFAQARAAKSLARLGRHDEAIARTQTALGLSPNSRALRLELGSRFIDAKKWEDAAAVLSLLATEAPTGEHLLRLGYALLMKGDAAKAEDVLKRALAAATSPREWRTRARANEDLALLAARRGQKEPALLLLAAAQKEGYRPRQFAPELQPLARELERRALQPSRDAGRTAALTLAFKDASPFKVGPDGEVDLKAPRPAPFPALEPFKAEARSPFVTQPK